MKSTFKKLALLAAIGFTGLMAGFPAAQAATVAGTFNVSASLEALCVSTTAGTPAVNFGAYTAFGSAATPSPTAELTFKCTRGLAAPTMALDTANGTATATGVVGGAVATGDGVLSAVGLNYALSIAGAKTGTGSAPTTAPGATGSEDVYTFTVTGTMPSGQAGTCTTGTCGPDSHTRTLTITY